MINGFSEQLTPLMKYLFGEQDGLPLRPVKMPAVISSAPNCEGSAVRE
ncbi:hypothetical protein SSYIS1_02740 [Serratia symbiotica]|uniref:Uncharacterized protein n=1 Tax=Serratia symbiotica TaxID=138074 RepID=A0A455VHX5_9GAMM|nr:hypothetical protein SSYIS1_02740 [Serratia symbiotica]